MSKSSTKVDVSHTVATSSKTKEVQDLSCLEIRKSRFWKGVLAVAVLIQLRGLVTPSVSTLLQSLITSSQVEPAYQKATINATTAENASWPPTTSTTTTTTTAGNDGSKENAVPIIPLDQYALAARRRNSSLRFDWTNLPPQTELGKRIEQVQSQCLATNQDNKQSVVVFPLQWSGLGATFHTWYRGICQAAEYGHVLLTRSGRFQWNDEEICPSIIQKQQSMLSNDRQASSNASSMDSIMDTNVPTTSGLWCYFGHHESALRCPAETLNISYLPPDRPKWNKYKCPQLTNQYGREGVAMGAAEWLFQNVSTVVIQEAERQIEAASFLGSIRTWGGMADSLITVHIRWGDKYKEMTLRPIEDYVNATLSLLTSRERLGQSKFHIYLATEDPTAIQAFEDAMANNTSTRNLQYEFHSSGPKNPVSDYKMTDLAHATNGKAGLESMGALLVSLEANRYVLTLRSNWSLLIDELRKSIVDSRCNNCTIMVNVS